MTDRLIAILFLGLTLLASVLCSTWLVATDHTIPDALIALGSAAGGALAGVLVPRSPSV